MIIFFIVLYRALYFLHGTIAYGILFCIMKAIVIPFYPVLYFLDLLEELVFPIYHTIHRSVRDVADTIRQHALTAVQDIHNYKSVISHRISHKVFEFCSMIHQHIVSIWTFWQHIFSTFKYMCQCMYAILYILSSFIFGISCLTCLFEYTMACKFSKECYCKGLFIIFCMICRGIFAILHKFCHRLVATLYFKSRKMATLFRHM